jgi:type II restriction enzyme
VVDLSFYKLRYGIAAADAAFEKFVGTLQSYFDADYYVGWDKIYEKIERHRPELYLLSSLCSAQNKKKAARDLLIDYPKVIMVLPLLMACRKSVQLMDRQGESHVTSYEFPKKARQLSRDEIEHYARFLCESRILELLEHIKSVPDYVTGVEVGMDTNGRKNRGGECGVKAIQPHVSEALKKFPAVQSKAEATFDFLASQRCCLPEEFRYERWDWAFWTKDEPRRLTVMEVNHFGSGGSKLKAIAREYIGRQKALSAAGVGFIWVTDGMGWLKSRHVLREAFDAVGYLVNVRLAGDGQLEWALRRQLCADVKGQQEHAA